MICDQQRCSYNWIPALEKGTVRSFGTSRFSYRANNFLFLLGPWPKVWESRLPTKCKLRLAEGEQNLRAACPKGKLEFKFFPNPGFATFPALFAQAFHRLQGSTGLWALIGCLPFLGTLWLAKCDLGFSTFIREHFYLVFKRIDRYWK